MHVNRLYIYTVYILSLIYYCQTAVITTQTTKLELEPKKIIKFRNSNVRFII